MSANVLWFSELGLDDLDQVGGKNSSLGEMVQTCRRQVCVCRTGSPLQQTPIADSSPTRIWPKPSPCSSLTSTSTTSRAWPSWVAASVRRWSPSHSHRISRLRFVLGTQSSPVVTSSCRSRSDPARRRRTCPTRLSPASGSFPQHSWLRRHHAGHQRGVRVSL